MKTKHYICGNEYPSTLDELVTDRTYTLSWNMKYTGDWWLWSLADLNTLFDSVSDSCSLSF